MAAQRATWWTPTGRAVVFVLSATSIWCLLSDFYSLMSMRAFAVWVFLPCTGLLAAATLADALRAGGDRRLARAVMIGALAGLVAACAYDLFRIPFVFAEDWGIDGVVPGMRLFKVFPRFGAMLLGEPIEQQTYSAAAMALGWLYHFSNGATFGVMYMALVGRASGRAWWWAVLFATGLEAGLLLSPYTSVFAIEATAAFVVVTMAAHGVFGAALGLWAQWQEGRWKTA